MRNKTPLILTTADNFVQENTEDILWKTGNNSDSEFSSSLMISCMWLEEYIVMLYRSWEDT